ncbi:MAG: hypothetical protein JWM98_2394 [Thermoleophilia bacterium]|nr:hypothetical protein [Thermoleophilia bacterium]
MDATEPTADQPMVLLCPACAAETGLDDEAHSIPPLPGDVSAACEHCGATLVGFAYRVPRDSYTGMAPGAG